MPNQMDVRIEWHSPDAIFAATFLRTVASSQGRPVLEPWYLNGALVGMGGTRGDAVDDLLELADFLVMTGENFLTQGQLSLEDRQWLFETLDWGNDVKGREARYVANRRAQEGLCANCGQEVSHPGQHFDVTAEDPWKCF